MRRIVGSLAVVVLVLAGCGGSASKKGAPVSLQGQTNDHGTRTAKDDLDVETDDYYFGPTFIAARAGQQFSVKLRNEGSTRHTFTGVGVDLELAPGAARTVTLTAPASGVAEFHCRFHQSQGMQGAVYIR
jgi:plastocyanin